jgi:CheY-like chemotaxis protein
MSSGSDDIVHAITERGANELKGGATTLDSHELELLVLVDGRRSADAIAKLVKAGDPSQVAATLFKLEAGGFVRTAAPAPNEGFDFFFSSDSSGPSEHAMRTAEQEAANGAATLRENGYYVSIARRAKAQAQAATRGLAVLVVEDEPLVAKFLKALVESEGHVVRIASNREEILAEIRKAPLPDLVFLDVMLPDANGFDVLHRMKAHPALAEIPVVIVTTQATRESVMKGLALGADGYFTKPFEIEVLLRGMKAVLGRLKAGSDAPKKKPGAWD